MECTPCTLYGVSISVSIHVITGRLLFIYLLIIPLVNKAFGVIVSILNEFPKNSSNLNGEIHL